MCYQCLKSVCQWVQDRQTAMLEDWQIVAPQHLTIVADCRQIDAFLHDTVIKVSFKTIVPLVASEQLCWSRREGLVPCLRVRDGNGEGFKKRSIAKLNVFNVIVRPHGRTQYVSEYHQETPQATKAQAYKLMLNCTEVFGARCTCLQVWFDLLALLMR